MTKETTSTSIHHKKKPVEYGMNYIYAQYKKTTDKPLSQAVFSSIWKDYAQKMMTKVIENKYDFKLQAQLGSVYIISKKIQFLLDENGNLIRKGFRVDWRATRELWDEDEDAKQRKQVIYHFNEHSGRRNYRFYWDKRLSKLKYQSYYMFYPSRKWKRTLAKHIKSDDFDTIYYEI